MAGSRPQSHGDAIGMENSLELSITCCKFLATTTTIGETAAAATTANKSTATTVLHKWKSKL